MLEIVFVIVEVVLSDVDVLLVREVVPVLLNVLVVEVAVEDVAVEDVSVLVVLVVALLVVVDVWVTEDWVKVDEEVEVAVKPKFRNCWKL